MLLNFDDVLSLFISFFNEFTSLELISFGGSPITLGHFLIFIIIVPIVYHFLFTSP